MSRKKKEITETLVAEEVLEETVVSEEEKEVIKALEVPHIITEKPVIKTKESYLFQIAALTDGTKLYKRPSLNNPQGRLKKGQVCNVVCEINYTPVKMYKLSTGYYIIADQNIKKL